MGPLNVEERLNSLEAEIAEIRVKMGTVQLSAPTLALLWTVLLVAITSVMFIVRLDSKVDQYARIADEAYQHITQHMAADGHAVSNERILDLAKRLDGMQSQRSYTSTKEAQ